MERRNSTLFKFKGLQYSLKGLIVPILDYLAGC